jgi:diguanylate cyclase (GGDEF)-like protein/PAS domain S-box-containing protein
LNHFFSLIAIVYKKRQRKKEITLKRTKTITFLDKVITSLKEKKSYIWRSDDRQLIHPKPLMRSLMVPLLILIVFFTLGAGVLLYHQYFHNLERSFEKDNIELNHDLDVLLGEQTSSLQLTLKTIVNHTDTLKALRNKDRDALMMQWQVVFEKMKAENGLTHFYFFDKNRVCLLRIHNPSKRGDLINRFTALEAEWKRKSSSGLEIGPLGTLTLRVVQPVIVNNELIGYIELGKEIEDILQQLHFQSNIHLGAVLRKEFLNRKNWEEGMNILTREANWNLFKKEVLIYASNPKLVQLLTQKLGERLQQRQSKTLNEALEVQGNSYRFSTVVIKDVSGREIGEFFLIRNITHEKREFFDVMTVAAIISFVVIFLMSGFFYLFLRRTDEGIKNQQRFLLESQQRLEQLARHSRSIIWEVDEQGMYTYVSDVAYDVLGYTSTEMIGRYFYDLHPEGDREAFKKVALEVFQRKEPFTNFKNRAVNKEGMIVWLMTNGIPILSPDGRLLGYRGNDTDITEWQKAEDVIVESRNLLDTIIDTIPIRVFWKSKTLRYLGCNTLFARDAGLDSPQKLIGKNDYQMTWSPEAELYRTDDFAVMESGVPKLFYEEKQTTPDGDTIWLSTSKIPLKNSAGEIIGILGTYEDITQQKEMQSSLRINAKMLNEAQHFAHMGSWSLDLRHNNLVWSDEVYNIFEIDKTRFGATYEAFLNQIHPDDREMVNHAYLNSLQTKEPYALTHRLLMEDGRIKWVRETGISEFDEEGNPMSSMGTVQDISDRKIAEDTMNQLAFFDSLTDLPNRTLLMDRLKQARVISDRNGQFSALLFVDLDNFKMLNDTLGHGMGDELLQQAALRFRTSLREGDTVARFGGDEFVVLLLGLGGEKKQAASVAKGIGKKILATLNAPYELETLSYQLSASMGITLFKGNTINNDELMKQADLAMYKSKDAGRNTLSFFDPEMERSLKERALMEEEIRRGIDEEQFILYYQPQVDEKGIVYAAEVLIRWNHPERGIVSPAEFIPIAEETGMILPLGKWILKRACEVIAAWEDQELFSPLSLAVNVSVRQFNEHDFVEQVLSVLKESRANPSRLKLELTESLLVHNIEETIGKMERLRAQGIHFSLDDFGTGYSSLSYLKKLPLAQLKIDQSFVRDILTDSNDAIICKSTIALAESMGLSVIAEGVETHEQFESLFSFGCLAYQGYWFSRPLPLEAFEAYHNNNVLMQGDEQ